MLLKRLMRELLSFFGGGRVALVYLPLILLVAKTSISVYQNKR